MIDFHNHFIYNLDDGPSSIEESMDMLHHANSQGITEVIQTVHFQHPKMDGRDISNININKKLKKIQSLMKDQGINIKIHIASEVFYLPNLSDILNNPLTTIFDRYMLIEFTTNVYPENYENEFFKIQNKGITPIIAHPERYRFVQNDLNIINKWISNDYLIQIDCGSLLGHFGKKIKQISYNIIENYGVHIIGSDAHNNKKRNFCLEETYNLLLTKYNMNFVEKLKLNTSILINGGRLNKVQPEQKNSLLNIIKSKFKLN